MDTQTPLHKWATSKNPLCLDLRLHPLHNLLHSANIPLHTLNENWHALPHKQMPFMILLPTNHEFREGKVHEYLKQKGWNVTYAVVPDPGFWEVAEKLGLGTQTRNTKPLFQACPPLQRIMSSLPPSGNSAIRLAQLGSDTIIGTVLDLGCGAGRDIVSLLRHKVDWNAVGCDNWKGSLRRTERLAKDWAVYDRCELLNIDFDRRKDVSIKEKIQETRANITDKDGSYNHTLHPKLGHDEYSLILSIRFFRRFLLPEVLSMLCIGGIFILHHFVEGDYSHPPPIDRLELGEGKLLLEGCQHESLRVEWIEDHVETIEDGRQVWTGIIRRIL